MTTFDYTSNPTAPALSADEFSAFLAQEKLERTMANIARRAETLWADGYVIDEMATLSCTDCYHIRTPKGDEYSVHIERAPVVFGDDCNCPAYAKFGDCKHHIAILTLRAEEAQTEAWEALMENAETAEGCDPYARY